MLRSYRSTLVCALLLAAALSPPCHGEKKSLPAVRWSADAPGCEFHRDDDGRYRWRLVSNDLDLTLLIDSQELSKSRRRFFHVLSVYVSVIYTGKKSFEFPADVRLTLLRHRNVTEAYLDPTELQTRLQNGVDTMVFDTEREIKKHPEESEEKTARLREYQKEASEFIEFLTTQNLQPAMLTPGNPEAHGWVFFGTGNKWIGPWKPREDFLFFIWTKDKVYEFPVTLPPSDGDVILRKREE